jgi:NADH-quinone oxidoreductase subunit A
MLIINALYGAKFAKQIAVEHLVVAEFFCFTAIIISLIVGLSYLIAPFTVSQEKTTSYECGFEPYGDARTAFDIHFYIIGILFLLFDLEVVFLAPWIFTNQITVANVVTALTFLLLLGYSFYYEWTQGALAWVSTKKKNAST